jgi:hypothetical protein
MPEQTAKKVHIIPRGKASQQLLAVIAVLLSGLTPGAVSATVIEDFEDGDVSDYTPIGSLTFFASAAAAHDGAWGVSVDSAGGWRFRDDTGVEVAQGDVISVWVNLGSRPTGRAYFGFGATAAGTMSLVAAANTQDLRFQANPNYGFIALNSSPQVWLPNKWYRMEIIWEVGGGLTGNLYDSDGVTLINTVSDVDNTFASGGIAFRAFGSSVTLFDTIEVVLDCFVVDAIDDEFSVINDGASADLLVLANDECKADTPISVVELPGDLLPDRGGSATTDGATVNYTPAAGFVGFEEFTYTAQDAGLTGGEDPPAVDQDKATVVVDVLEDITPDAVDDLATALENQATIIDVLANDSLGNAPNGVAIETAPASGSATVQANDTIQYSPNFGFFGDDSFEYRLTDANGDSDVAAVTICVFGGGQLPIDIMPSDPGNNLNLRAGSGASISVAVLSASQICAAPNLIDPLTLEFGPGQAGISGNPRARDVDGDGDQDLLVKFLTNETGIACGDTHASLSGHTFDSLSISGSDATNTFNCPRTRKRY